MPRKPKEPLERFKKLVKEEPETGCHLWQGTKANGYGTFDVRREDGHWLTVNAHRWIFEQTIGPVPLGLVLDHVVCDNRGCVNPEHTRPVTQRENILRGDGPSAKNARKTHCPRGHPYDGENTTVSGGKRYCKSCRRARYRREKEFRLAED